MKISAIALVAAALPAYAQFKCTGPDGTVSFQQAPCTTAERSERLVLPASAPTSDRPEIVRWALAKRRIVAGLTRDELRRVMLAAPERVNTTVAGGVRSEQQIYHRDGATFYVYLDDGVVTAVQVRER
jgi:hypothetical protein